MGRKKKKDKSKKAKDYKGGKFNPPEEIQAEIHAEQSDGEEIQENPVEIQAEEEAVKDLQSMKWRKKTPKLNLDEEQEDDLVNWYKVNEIFYNQNQREFKDKAKKDQMMSEKAKEIHISLDLKGWLTSM